MLKILANYLQSPFHRLIGIFWLLSVFGEIGLGFLYNPNIRLPISEQTYPLITVVSVIVIGTLHLLLLLGCYHTNFFRFPWLKIAIALLISIGFMLFSNFILIINFHSPPSLVSWFFWEMAILLVMLSIALGGIFKKLLTLIE